MMTTGIEIQPVRKSVTVEASQQRAFEVFTAGFDTWWPRSHHIGSAPMLASYIEGKIRGRCYTTHTDGTESGWGEVLVWEPPQRFVMAWKISPEWGYEPDLAKASEVEVRFTDLGDGKTQVDLEHRHFERMGPDGAKMREGVGGEGGWTMLIDGYAAKIKEG